MPTPAFDAMHGHVAPGQSADKLSTDEALGMLAQAFEMDWNTVQAEKEAEDGTWPMGKTLWFSVLVSAGLWSIIVGIAWLI